MPVLPTLSKKGIYQGKYLKHLCLHKCFKLFTKKLFAEKTMDLKYFPKLHGEGALSQCFDLILSLFCILSCCYRYGVFTFAFSAVVLPVCICLQLSSMFENVFLIFNCVICLQLSWQSTTDLEFLDNVHHPLCLMCHFSHVISNVSHVMCRFFL